MDKQHKGGTGMGRVETRMYKRKRKRARTLRRVMILLILAAAAVLLWRGGGASFVAERIGLPNATPISDAFDQTPETREVTLPEETWYAIQTGVFSTQEAALQKAEAYSDRGAPGTVVKESEKWRVFIACYGSEQEASSVRARLEQNQKVDTYLYAWICPELRLRLTSKAGLLDVVEAGFTLLNTTAVQLRDTAIALDAAQLTHQEALAEATALKGQMELWEQTARKRFGSTIPDLVQNMLDMTSAWDARFGNLQASEDATALSAALKAEAMGMFDDIATWRRALAEK